MADCTDYCCLATTELVAGHPPFKNLGFVHEFIGSTIHFDSSVIPPASIVISIVPKLPYFPARIHSTSQLILLPFLLIFKLGPVREENIMVIICHRYLCDLAQSLQGTWPESDFPAQECSLHSCPMVARATRRDDRQLRKGKAACLSISRWLQKFPRHWVVSA